MIPPRYFLAVCACALLASARDARAQRLPVVTVRDGAVLGDGVLEGEGGGPLEASGLDPACRGYVASSPSAAVRVERGAPFVRLFAEAHDASDLVLLVRAPDGRVACSDDRWGRDPGLDAALGAGVYYVWVGTFRRGPAARFALSITLDPARRSRGAALRTFEGAAQLRGLDDAAAPRVALDEAAVGRSGGALDASTVAPGCNGWIDPASYHVLSLDAPAAFVRVFARAQADTTLVVRRPDGTFVCADDTWGQNPAVEGAFERGAYAIWVGSYVAATRAPYRLYFATSLAEHP